MPNGSPGRRVKITSWKRSIDAEERAVGKEPSVQPVEDRDEREESLRWSLEEELEQLRDASLEKHRDD